MTSRDSSNLDSTKTKINNHKTTLLCFYTFIFFVLFIIIVYKNIIIQQVPNFNYQVLPTGQWAVIDDTHPTVTKDTVDERYGHYSSSY